MQAIFRMGIPVVGKNVFPSNIQGLPTWYEIRVSKDGYTARTAPFDLMVAMNTGTYARDVQEIKPGGYLMYDSSWPMAKSMLRDDINVIGIPLGEMCNNTFKGDREAHPDEEHRLHRRPGRAAGDRHGRRSRDAAGKVREEEAPARVELQGDPPGL
jgi:Pyruvate/2-oxoacid:ferredoxin oxidoreductase gamma subunit